MPRLALTDRFVAGAKSKQPQTDFFDEKTAGLALRVSSAGHKAWTLLFTAPRDGKRARMTLGSYPATSLAEARTKAMEARGYLDEKPPRDPRDVMAEQAAGAMTVVGLIESYLEKHARPNLRSAKAIERRLSKNVTPIIGGVKLAELHRRDINRVVDPVLKRERRIEAARVFEDLRAVLRWAERRGDLDRNPMTAMQKPNGSTPRERMLSDDEITTLWAALPTALTKSKSCQRVVKLCLVTAQRVGEVAGMRRDELDLKQRLWRLPGERVKNKHPHSVPLSDFAMTIIAEALADVSDDAQFLFPDEAGAGSLPPHAVAKTLTRAQKPDDERPQGRFGIAPFTAHDLRRTAVSHMGALGIPPLTRGHVINHRSVTRAGVTLGVYDHYDYAKEKEQALSLWAERLNAIVGSGSASVTPVGRAKAS